MTGGRPRLRQVVQSQIDAAQREMRLPCAIVEFEAFEQNFLGVLVARLLAVDLAEREVGLRGLGVDFDGAAQRNLGFAPVALLHEGRAEQQMSFKEIRVDADSLLYMLAPFINILLVQ